AYKLHRMICNRETEVLRPLVTFEATAKGNWDRHRRAEEQKRRDEEARLAEEARRVEQDRLAKEAEQLHQRGETQLAEMVLEQAVAVPAPVIIVASSLPQVRGVTARANWQWRPVGGDTPANRARAVQLIPREFLCLDEKKLTAHAKAHQGTKRIPGIEFYDAGTVSVRS